MTFWYSHGITSRTATEGMRENCDFSRIGPLAADAQQASARRGAHRLLICGFCPFLPVSLRQCADRPRHRLSGGAGFLVVPR